MDMQIYAKQGVVSSSVAIQPPIHMQKVLVPAASNASSAAASSASMSTSSQQSSSSASTTASKAQPIIDMDDEETTSNHDHEQKERAEEDGTDGTDQGQAEFNEPLAGQQDEDAMADAVVAKSKQVAANQPKLAVQQLPKTQASSLSLLTSPQKHPEPKKTLKKNSKKQDSPPTDRESWVLPKAAKKKKQESAAKSDVKAVKPSNQKWVNILGEVCKKTYCSPENLKKYRASKKIVPASEECSKAVIEMVASATQDWLLDDVAMACEVVFVKQKHEKALPKALNLHSEVFARVLSDLLRIPSSQ